MANLDEETRNILTDAEEVINLLDSKGWGVIKGKLDLRILDLQNINNLDTEKPDTLSMQLLARKMSVDTLFSWLKDDVYGSVEQAQANHIPPNEKDTGFIERA